MNLMLYGVVTLALFAAEVYLGIIVGDITTIFGYIGTVAGTGLQFFIPSTMFLRAYNLFASPSDQVKERKLFILCIGNLLLGFVFFGFYLYADIV
jgi:hypothetical protein